MVLLPDDIPVVLHVVGQLVCLDAAESGTLQILARLFLTPRRPETFAALGE